MLNKDIRLCISSPEVAVVRLICNSATVVGLGISNLLEARRCDSL